MKLWRLAVLALLFALGLPACSSQDKSETNPKDAPAYLNRGVAHAQKGDWEKAIADFTRATELNPKFEIAYFNRGRAYHHKGDWDRAIADYNRALEIDPKYWEALYHKANLLDKSGKGKEARGAYITFLKNAPPQEEYFIQRAQERIKALENQAGN